MATTEQLIRDVQRGNGQAREELYRRYALRVVFLVRARMGPSLRLKEQSGDIAQEALLKSLRGLQKFFHHADGAFVGYLARKVEEVICDRVDYWNAAKRDPQRELPVDIGHASRSVLRPVSVPPFQEVTPDDVLEQNEDLEQLARALDRLHEVNEGYWELVLAVDLESRGFSEIATELGRSPDAVRKKHERAKDALVRIFGQLDAK